MVGGSGRGGGVGAEAAQQLHPHPCGVTTDDAFQEPVLRGERQTCHPGSQFAGIVSDVLAVRAILTNPRYTGHQVWNKERKQEVLLDVDDVALGHVTKLALRARGRGPTQHVPASQLARLPAARQAALRMMRPPNAGGVDSRHRLLPLPVPE